MKLLITSDLHGSYHLVDLIHQKEDFTLHLDAGDSEFEFKDLNSHGMISVRGNCDYLNNLPLIRILTIENQKIMLTHGHLYGVKLGLEKLVSAANQNSVDIVIFGHTHIPLIKKIGKLLILNPGSLKYRNTYLIYDGNQAYLKEL